MGIIAEILDSIRLILGGKSTTEALPLDLSYTGKHIFIIGTTSCLGLEATINYVNLGAERVIIITGRTQAKGEKAKLEIEKRTQKRDIVDVMALDIFDGVRNFDKELEVIVEEIDIVLLNAAVHDFEHILSPDGWESDIQVNALSTLLISLLMLP